MKLSIPPHVAAIDPYVPGKPLEELARQYGQVTCDDGRIGKQILETAMEDAQIRAAVERAEHDAYWIRRF